MHVLIGEVPVGTNRKKTFNCYVPVIKLYRPEYIRTHKSDLQLIQVLNLNAK